MDERLKSAHESLNTSYCSITLELNCFLVSIFWCATGSTTKRKVMTNSHVCPSLWQEKQKKKNTAPCTDSRVFIKSWRKMSGNLEGILSQKCKVKQSAWSNRRLLTHMKRRKEREGHKALYSWLSHWQSFAVIALLIFIHYHGTLNIIHGSSHPHLSLPLPLSCDFFFPVEFLLSSK